MSDAKAFPAASSATLGLSSCSWTGEEVELRVDRLLVLTEEAVADVAPRFPRFPLPEPWVLPVEDVSDGIIDRTSALRLSSSSNLDFVLFMLPYRESSIVRVSTFSEQLRARWKSES